MQSTYDRKKSMRGKAVLPSVSSDLKTYDEIYQIFCNTGYTQEIARLFAKFFVDEGKNPSNKDIIQAAELYDKIRDTQKSLYYLGMLKDKKLNHSEKFDYCVLMLRVISKRGKWRDAETFRTQNISFLQTYAEKTTPERKTSLYISLALADCAAKKYKQAFKMLKSADYKPIGKRDTVLMEILITGIYIYACAEDTEVSRAVSVSVRSTESDDVEYDQWYFDWRIEEAEKALQTAIANAESGLKIAGEFEFAWCIDYYKKRIKDASRKII